MALERRHDPFAEGSVNSGVGELARLRELERRVPLETAASGRRSVAASRLLWNGRARLYRIALWGLLVSTAIAFLLPTYYRSTTRLMPPPQSSNMGLAALSMMAGRSNVGMNLAAGDLLGLRSPGSLFIGVLQSRLVEDHIIEQFGLQHLYRSRTLQDTRKRLARETSISEERTSGILTISVTDEDPYRASEMARAYVDELNRRLAEVNTSSAHRERVFLESQLQETKKSLDDTAAKFSQFASQNTAIDIQEQGKSMVAAAARLQGEMMATQSELKGLEQIYTSNNVRVRALRARNEELQKQLQKLGGAETDAGSTDDLSGYPSIRKLPLLGVTYYDLFRQTKMLETVYEVLNQEYQLAKVQEAKELPNARVLDPAEIPEKRAGPIRTLIMFTGMMLAFGAGIVWMLATAAWERIDPNDPRKELADEIFSTARGRLLHMSSSRVWLPLHALTARFNHRTTEQEAGGES